LHELQVCVVHAAFVLRKIFCRVPARADFDADGVIAMRSCIFILRASRARRKRHGSKLPWRLFCAKYAVRGLVAAAAKNDQCDDNDPATVVIVTEDPADTVVIHSRSSLYELGRNFPSLLSFYGIACKR
jgi:hypothetical protein